MLLQQAQLNLAKPIRFLRSQASLLDKLLQISLPPDEFSAVKDACDRSGARFGAFYYWYLQKKLMADQVRRLDRPAMLNAIKRLDHTDYAQLNIPDNHSQGLLVAIPHHGHYIFSIVGLVERLRRTREVLIFYGSPKTHAGNELFDELHACLFGDPDSNARVVHDTRGGMAQAMRGLQHGAAVIIMPDVYKHERDTYLIPFCDRPLNVMLGTAILARKTNSAILPAVSHPSPTRLSFRTEFGQVLDGNRAVNFEAKSSYGFVHDDYRTTIDVFRFLEESMRNEIMYWQYCRSHYTRKSPFPTIEKESLDAIIERFFDDPRVNVDIRTAMRLDESPATDVQ